MRTFFLGTLVLALVIPAYCAPWQPFTALAVSADGTSMATGGVAGEVLWWEVLTGEVQVRTVLGSGVPVAGLSFSPDGRRLSILLLDGTAATLEAGAAAPEQLSDPRPPSPLNDAVTRWRTAGPPMSGTTATWGSRTAQGTPDGRITVTAPAAGPDLVWQAHTAAVTGLVWSQDGTVLYSCSFDGTLARWDGTTGKLIARL